MVRETIRIGFMPLADAAIPVVAARRGFGAEQGLDLALVRETSWANIRDRLAVGHFDAAHLLAPMPVATALGLLPVRTPLIAPMALGLGGNAVTVSAGLWREMRAADPEVRRRDPVSTGAALRRVVEARRRSGRPVPTFAVVHAFSAHNYELRYWLAAGGIAPDSDIAIRVLSPPLMPAALAGGGIDGVCVGEPWNTVAAQEGGAVILLHKTDIWTNSPEKVLGLRSDWADRKPDTAQRLLVALLRAAAWCADPANRDDLAETLAAADALGVPKQRLAPVLADGLEFAGNAATFPWRSHARWFAGQMVRWRQAQAGTEALEQAARVYRPDLYRAAMAAIGGAAPLVDEQPDAGGGAVAVPGTAGPMRLSPSRFFDR